MLLTDARVSKNINGRVTTKNILADLRHLKLPEKVVGVANDIFMSINTKNKKGNKRKELIFYCVYNAYMDLGMIVDPINVAREIEIKRESIPKAINTNFEGYKPGNRVIRPTSLIKEYVIRLDLECYLDEIGALGEFICSKTDAFEEEYPQKVSAAIIQLFFELNGIVIDNKMFVTKLNTTETTINNILKELRRVYNR
jgi:transcription initiation factor TFIIIB Brf1 subunit/transcription initiation factor TFIIB